jgi:hypothetical protein
MAFTPNAWVDGEKLTAAKMTSVETRLSAYTDLMTIKCAPGSSLSAVLPDPAGTSAGDDGKIADRLSAISSAGRGQIIVPAGAYSVSPDTHSMRNRSSLLGLSPGATISKAGNGMLLNVSGQAENSMIGRVRIEGIEFKGNDFTGPLLRIYHVFQAHLSDIEAFGNAGPALDYAHCWDSYCTNFFAEWCSSVDGTQPSIRIRNSAAASGVGFTTDSSNELYFRNIRLENFSGAGISISKGVSNSADPFGYRFQNVKLETGQHRTDRSFLSVEDARDVHFQNMILTSIGYQSGQSGAGVGIFWGPVGDSSLKQVRLYQNALRWHWGVQSYHGSGGAHVFEAIHGQGTGMSGAVLRYETANPALVSAIQADAGSAENGTRPKQPGAPTITGSRGANAALTDLLTDLDAAGLIVNSTT